MNAAWCALAALCSCTTIDDGFAIRIEARDAPVVVFQDGDGPWERLPTSADGVAEVQVYETTYGVGALCAGDVWKTAEFRFDTQAQTIHLSCPTTLAVQAPFVRGTTAPMATVWIGGQSVRADANGAFAIQVFPPGLHDLFALVPSTPPRLVAHRGIVVDRELQVDLPASEAVALMPIIPTVIGDPATHTVSADMNTPTDWIPFGADASTIYVPPPEMRLLSDRIAIAARDEHCTRQVPLDITTPIELPTPLTYAFDRERVSWTADPTVAWSSARVDVSMSPGTDYTAYASASWRVLRGASEIPIVDLAALPGWTGGLAQLAPEMPATLSFYISRGAHDGDFTSCRAYEQRDHW